MSFENALLIEYDVASGERQRVEVVPSLRVTYTIFYNRCFENSAWRFLNGRANVAAFSRSFVKYAPVHFHSVG